MGFRALKRSQGRETRKDRGVNHHESPKAPASLTSTHTHIPSHPIPLRHTKPAPQQLHARPPRLRRRLQLAHAHVRVPASSLAAAEGRGLEDGVRVGLARPEGPFEDEVLAEGEDRAVCVRVCVYVCERVGVCVGVCGGGGWGSGRMRICVVGEVDECVRTGERKREGTHIAPIEAPRRICVKVDGS